MEAFTIWNRWNAADIMAYIMEKRVRIAAVEKQDTFRREDMLQMTPAERIDALIQMRDQINPDKPLERIVSIRKLH